MHQRVEKTLAIASFVFLIGSLSIALMVPPAKGYELSIYDSLPASFWFSIVSSIACGVLVIVYSAIYGKSGSRLWVVGFVGVLMATAVFLFLPVLRGYFLGFDHGWDALTHIGEIKRVIQTGHTSGDNFYPILHVLGSSIVLSTSLTAESTATALVLFFMAFYLTSICLLARSLEKERGGGLILVAFASPLVFSYFHRTINPSFLSLYAVPLLLFFWHEHRRSVKSRTSKTIAILLLAFFVTLSHPITTLTLIGILAIFAVFDHLREYSSGLKDTAHKLYRKIEKSSSNMLLILSVAFLAWYLSFSSIVGNFARVVDWLLYQEAQTISAEYLQLLSVADLTLPQAIWIFLNQLGAVSIYLILSFISVFLIIEGRLRKREVIPPTEVLYGALFSATFIVSVLFFFGNFIEHELIRILRFPLLISIILNGFLFSRLIAKGFRARKPPGKSERKYLLTIAVVFVILVSVTISIFNTYGSSRTLRRNEEITYMDASGVEWFLSHSDHNVTTVSNLAILRYEDLFVCFKEKSCRRAPTEPNMIPSHFGYQGNLSVWATFNFEDRYMITTEYDRMSPMIFPPDLRSKKAHWYLEEDFERLLCDTTISRLYSNGEFDVWRVHGL